ncbi:MAG: site-specific integrase, partial [Desulfovibrionaceae bacterium]
MAKWKSSRFPGVRYREHPTRKIGRQPDRYYAIRYRIGPGQSQREEGVGWTSEGWSAERVAHVLGEIRQNIRTGNGPRSLEAMREQADLEARRQEQEARIRHDLTFGFVASMFLNWSKNNKASYPDDKARLNLHILPIFGALPINGITSKHIEDAKTTLMRKPSRTRKGANLAPATVHQCLALIRTVFNFARYTPHPDDPTRTMFTGLNPARMSKKFKGGVRPIPFDNRRLRVFTDHDLGVLFEALCASS